MPTDALDLSEEHYRVLIEQVQDVITIVDEEGTVRYQSPSSEHVKGWPPASLVGENILEYIHPEDRDRVAERIRDAAEQSGRFDEELEYRFRTPEGEWRWLASTANDPGPDSPIEGYIVASRDVTDRKRLEAERQREQERLETFASVVSHDLRNPLNVLSGYLDLAEETGDPEHFERCRTAVGRMETLIDDLLTLARDGKTVGEFESVDLGALAEACWGTVETEDATLEVHTELTIRADESRLRQVLENLIRNAVEHGGEDVTITVGALPEAEGFYLEDDGPGIPPEKREQVFKPGHSTAEEGTGFGLAIVKEIAEAHGWAVHLTEGPAGGARFEFTGVEVA